MKSKTLSFFLLLSLPLSTISKNPNSDIELIINEILNITCKGLLFTLLSHNKKNTYNDTYSYNDIYYQDDTYDYSYDSAEKHPENSHILLHKAGSIKTNFNSVAGNHEAKKSLQNIIDYLKNPKKYQTMGAYCPKGVLFSGAPGTGKTLLAEALAGEAGCNFITASGSDFVEVYVGQGAKRVREVFEMARKTNNPCIIFIDELDSLAKKRGDCNATEYDHALNQFLTELDGCVKDKKRTIIIIGATNNKDCLDPAVLRSGRFDYTVEFNLPNETERKEILNVHMKKVKQAANIDLSKIAKKTSGFSGADLANLVNTAAITAVKQNAEKVTESILITCISQIEQKLSNDSSFMIYPSGTIKENFDCVAGNHEAKEALGEIINYLKNPQAYYQIGAQPPFGVLLTGEPGTGKTLLARATAGETNCSFIAISGSDFANKWAGSSVEKIKNIFHEARKSAPTIIFFDEFDGIGFKRSENYLDHNQTVNQLLIELDGFNKNNPQNPVIVIAATNNLSLLDEALLRPGRLDRIINISLPNITCRKEILQIHLKKIKHNLTEEHIHKIASGTPGFSGADLSQLVNQAALVALKKGEKTVLINHFEEARDLIIMGSTSPTMKISQKELEVTAYHEAGHALIRLLMPNPKQVLHKITIQPRNTILGFAEYFPETESYDITKKDILESIAIALGGRAAEELQFNTLTAGAQNDFIKATKLARSMVCDYGMSDLGTQVFLNGYSYSQQTLEKIDFQVTLILKTQYDLVINLLKTHKDKLDKLAKELLKKETLYASEIYTLLGLKPQTNFILN